MAQMTDIELAEAERRGQEMLASEVRAVHARYEPSGEIVICLSDACIYCVPAALIEDLSRATPTELALVQVDGQGFNLHWPTLDVDLYVPALVAGVFGTKA